MYYVSFSLDQVSDLLTAWWRAVNYLEFYVLKGAEIQYSQLPWYKRIVTKHPKIDKISLFERNRETILACTVKTEEARENNIKSIMVEQYILETAQEWIDFEKEIRQKTSKGAYR